MRDLIENELNNLELLAQNSVYFTLIEPTQTGLNKSIMDATLMVRNLLSENSIHDFDAQTQGQENKVVIPFELLSDKKVISSKCSLYRPNTKKGDPRIWISNLKDFLIPNDILAIIYFDSKLFGLNVSKINLQRELEKESPISDLIDAIRKKESPISSELLKMIQGISSRGPIASIGHGDTAIGKTLESELGIRINSSKTPDYKGIELKAFRSERGNRKNLFAQVPDWSLSKFKSSEEILNSFGYWREKDFKMYCTISSKSYNSLGLKFKINQNDNLLIENSDEKYIDDFAIWRLEKLHKRLKEKHNETFWIKADSSFYNGQEYFHYKTITHTKKPIIPQFDLLLKSGVITMDHLIKKLPSGRVKEKGPIFKIETLGLKKLFPPSNVYNL